MSLVVLGPNSPKLRRRRLKALAKQLLASEGLSPRTQVALLLCDDAHIQDLNRRYRGKDSPTDVLSFPQNDPNLLGDVVISLETASKQAEEFGHSLQNEVERLLVHGILHLLGYDHETPEEEKLMKAKEDAALDAVNRL